MTTDLKTELKEFKKLFKEFELKQYKKNIFNGTGVVYLTVENELGKKLGLKKEHGLGYVYDYVSSNGCIGDLPRMIKDEIESFQDRNGYDMKITLKEMLL